MSDDTPPVPAAEDVAPAGPSGPDHQTSDTSPDQTGGDDTTWQGPLTAQEAKVLADKAIESNVIQKKVPAVDDTEGQAKALSGALASALLTATEMPLHMLQPVVGDLAAQLVAYGIRQTEHIDPEAVHAPAWITDGVKQESVKVPDQPSHTEAEPFVVRTATAPEPPKRIPKGSRAVRR